MLAKHDPVVFERWRGGRDLDGASMVTGLDDRDAPAVECITVVCFVGIVIGGVAVTDAEDAGIAGEAPRSASCC